MKVNRAITVEEFREYARSMKDSDHPLVTLTEEVLSNVVEVIECYIEEAETYEDTRGIVLVRLTEEEYGVFQENSDSSGHG